MNMFATIRRYTHIWLFFARNAFQEQVVTRFSAVFFFLGKTVRYLFFFAFLMLLGNNTRLLAGYDRHALLLFYFTYNIIDVYTQMLLRGVYDFGWKIRGGEFDFYLLKPINPLFRALTGKPDFNDLFIAVPMTVIFLIFLFQTPANAAQYILFFLYLLNGFFIAVAFHIFVLSFGILFMEVDNVIWMYREVTHVSRFPLDIYREPIRSFFTYLVPVGIMMNAPVQALLGEHRLSLWVAPLLGPALLILSLITWRRAIQSYTSASS